MSILVTGGHGFIGRATVAALRQDGAAVIAPRRADCDLLNADARARLIADTRPDTLVHLAWETRPGTFWSAPENRLWQDASLDLVTRFLEGGGRQLVVAGTCAEYRWGPDPLDEATTALAPATLYGECKNALRASLVDRCRTAGAALAWGRVFFPCGPGEAPEKLIPMLVAALTGARAPFGVNADSRRDYLGVAAVGRAFATLVAHRAEGAFNIASGKATRIGDLVTLLAERLGADPRIVLDLPPSRPDRDPVILGTTARLSALGWQPGTLDDALDAVTR